MPVAFKYSPTPRFDAWLAENGPLDVADNTPVYDAVGETQTWIETKTRSQMRRRWLFGRWPNRPAMSYYLQRKMLTKILRRDPSCRKVVNFGTLYAKPDADIADAFPDVDVFGVDRSQNVQALNEKEFPGRSNLHFVASDILHFMRDHDLRDGLLVHAITGMFIDQKTMRSVYEQCATSGIRHIVVLELAGYSHQTRAFYTMGGETLAPSVAYRRGTTFHDYPNLLRAAGYQIVTGSMHKATMPKPMQDDAHVVAIHAISLAEAQSLT